MEPDTNTMPESGKEIIMDENGQLSTPSYAVIHFIEGDSKVQAVLDAVVEKVYAGEHRLVWFKVEDDGGSSQKYPVSFKVGDGNTIISDLYAGVSMFKLMDWYDAAIFLQHVVNETLEAKIVPEGFALSSATAPVSASDFCDILIENMHIGEEASEYDTLSNQFHKEFEESADNTAEFAKKTMEKAREQLNVAGKYTEEQGQKFKIFLENDFSRVTQEMKVNAKEKLNPSRLGTGVLSSMATLLHKTGVALSKVADKADDALTCKSGEITSAGKLACQACGYEMNFKKTGRIPPCPKCHKTEFKKGY